jgi:TRAP-type C4-dicarboxylate transport system permease small subunit
MIAEFLAPAVVRACADAGASGVEKMLRRERMWRLRRPGGHGALQCSRSFCAGCSISFRSTTFVQHLVLFVSMLGGALTAREGRLLSLAAVTYLPGSLRPAARLYGNAFGAAMSALLCSASAQFVLSRREAGETLAYGMPVWTLQAVLPAGFALIAGRLLLSASPNRSGRIGALLLAGALVLPMTVLPIEPAGYVVPALFTLTVATVAGAPVFVTLGGAALILFWGSGQTIAILPVDHYRLVVNPTLPTLPLFALAGYFLARRGVERLVRVFQTLFGWLRGGPVLVTTLSARSYDVHGCIRGDHSRAGWPADAGACIAELSGEARTRPADRRRFAGPAVPAVPAADPVCRRGDIGGNGSDHPADVPGRHRTGARDARVDGLVGHQQGRRERNSHADV